MNDIVTMIKSGYNPQQLVMGMLQQQMGGTPLGNNLINLAQQGNTQEIERIARNLMAQRGIDYDTEFAAFRKRMGL